MSKEKMNGKDATSQLFDELSFKIPETLPLEPWKDVPFDEWGTVPLESGETVPLPEKWRQVGLRVKYPTVTIENALLQAAMVTKLAKVEGRRGKSPVEKFDQVGVVRHHINHIVTGMYIIDQPDVVITYDKDAKQGLYTMFLACKFLWDKYAEEYDKYRQQAREEEGKESEAFTEPSTSTQGSISPKKAEEPLMPT